MAVGCVAFGLRRLLLRGRAGFFEAPSGTEDVLLAAGSTRVLVVELLSGVACDLDGLRELWLVEARLHEVLGDLEWGI